MKLLSFITLITIVLLALYSNIYSSDIIASWNNGEIAKDEYEIFALKYAFFSDSLTASFSSIEEKRDILCDTVDFKLIAILADSLGIDTLKIMRDTYQRRLYAVSKKHYLLPDHIRRKVFSDSEVKAFYDKNKFKYRIKHILFSSDGLNDEKQKLKAISVYKMLKNNPSMFSKIASEESDDKQSALIGGDLGWHQIGNFIPQFEKKVLNLKIGEISIPFKTKYGWHIAVLSDKKKDLSIGVFAKEKPRTINILKNIYSVKYENTKNDFIDSLFQKYQVKIFNNNIDEFVIKFNEFLKLETQSFFDLKLIDQSIVLATYKDNKIYVKDVSTYLSKIDKIKYPSITHSIIKQYVYYKFQNSLLAKLSDELGYTTKAEVINIAKEGMTLEYIDYLTDRFKGNKTKKNIWFKKLYMDFNVKLSHLLLENSFNNVNLDKKK